MAWTLDLRFVFSTGQLAFAKRAAIVGAQILDGVKGAADMAESYRFTGQSDDVFEDFYFAFGDIAFCCHFLKIGVYVVSHLGLTGESFPPPGRLSNLPHRRF